MSLVNRPIPQLFNGVSQQPASARAVSQAELQENCYPEIATGLRKRPSTVHIAKLSNTSDPGALIHWMIRDAVERYCLRLRSGTLEVWDLAGVSKTVNTPDGVDYLTSSDPASDFALITVADYTFIVNRTKKVAMLPDRFGRAVTPQTVNSITRSGAVATMTTALAHTLAIGDWVNIVGADQPEYNGWKQVVTVPSGTTLTYAVAGTPATPATGSISYTAIKAVEDGTKQQFSDLPGTPTLNHIWHVQGTPGSELDDYYVQYNGSVWVECAKPGSLFKLDPTTMPHVLIREADGSFTFKRATWGPRLVGDDNSNPEPSFVGGVLEDVFFHRNRLGFLSGENAILSRAGEYFEFFAETVTASLDSDPVDVGASSTKVANLRTAVSFNKSLVIFSDNTQFQLASGETLTPKTARLEPATEFESDAYVRPTTAGQTLFFTTFKNGYTGVREYFVEVDSLINDAADITAHVPKYIRGNAFELSASSQQDVLLCLTDHAGHEAYLYKYYWGDTQSKLQSAWSKWVFTPSCVIMSTQFVSSTIFFAMDYADGLYLEAMDLQPGVIDAGLPYMVLLDRKVLLTGVYDAGNNWTTWTLPYSIAGHMNCVLGSDWGPSAGKILSPTRPSDTTVRSVGDWSAHPVVVGMRYTSRYRFSEQFLRDGDKNSVASAELTLLWMNVVYEQSGYFRAEVTPKGRNMSVTTFTGKVIGESIIGQPTLDSGTFRFPIMADSHKVTIDLVNDSPVPSTFQAADWDARAVMRARR